MADVRGMAIKLHDDSSHDCSSHIENDKDFQEECDHDLSVKGLRRSLTFEIHTTTYHTVRITILTLTRLFGLIISFFETCAKEN